MLEQQLTRVLFLSSYILVGYQCVGESGVILPQEKSIPGAQRCILEPSVITVLILHIEWLLIVTSPVCHSAFGRGQFV